MMKWFILHASFFLFNNFAIADGAVISFGGGEDLLKVHALINNLAIKISNVPQFLLSEKFLYSRIQSEVKSLKIIISAKPIYWEGSEVFAINFPEEKPKRLVISQSKLNTGGDFDILLLHELLPIIGVMDRSYKVSHEIIDVVKNWQSWKSSEFFIDRYFQKNEFVKLWAEESKEYYENWGVDGIQLFVHLGLRVLPLKNEDSAYWLTIVENYLHQYDSSICEKENFLVVIDHIKNKQQKIYFQIFSQIKKWYSAECKPVSNATTAANNRLRH